MLKAHIGHNFVVIRQNASSLKYKIKGRRKKRASAYICQIFAGQTLGMLHLTQSINIIRSITLTVNDLKHLKMYFSKLHMALVWTSLIVAIEVASSRPTTGDHPATISRPSGDHPSIFHVLLSLQEGVEKGQTLAGKSIRDLQSGEYSVEASGGVFNLLSTPLVFGGAECAGGVITHFLPSIEKEMVEGFASRKTSGTATGTHFFIGNSVA